MLIQSIRRKGASVEFSFDEGSVILISYEIAFKSGLRKNDEISEAKLEDLIAHSDIFRVKEAAFRFIARRPHSRSEIYLKMIKKNFDKELVNKVLADLTEKNYINDTEFAEIFVRQALEQKKSGLMKIRTSLMKRGVAREIIDDVLNRHTDENEMLESALQLSEKKLKLLRSRGTDRQTLRKKIYAFLISRGFSHDICSNVINRIPGESEESE